MIISGYRSRSAWIMGKQQRKHFYQVQRLLDTTATVVKRLFLILQIAATFQGRTAHAVDLAQCKHPLGMQSGQILDRDISASSSFDSGNVGPHRARLGHDSFGGAWCPKNMVSPENVEWLEIDLHRVHVITGAATQGRFGNGQGAEFVESYMIEYWRPSLAKWHRFRNITGGELIPGNTNTYIVSQHQLDPPIWASKIRFIPYDKIGRTICMRVEIYGCPYNDGILSYSMPQGDKRNSREFYDTTYDGHWSDELRRGLGKLTDGKKYTEHFKSHHDTTRDPVWVGWKNETRSGIVRDHIEIKFEFDQVREFSTLNIYCNNQVNRDVQMFASVSVWFSIGGTYYTGDPIIYDNPEDRVFQDPRNATIKLHHRIGKYVKLRFTFAAKWIMISEISFESYPAIGNFTPESPPTTEAPRYRERAPIREIPRQIEPPVTTARKDEPTYMAVIIGILTAVILLLAVAIFLIITRHRQRKSFASPLATKNGIPPGAHHQQLSSSESAYGTNEKDPTLMGYRVDDLEDRYSGAKLTTLPRDLNDRLLGDVRLDEYQEPFRESKYRDVPHAAYYGYSTVVIDNKDLHDNIDHQSDATYDYAVPMPVPSGSSDQDSVFSKSSSRGSAKACLQSFFPPPPPPPLSAPPSRGSSCLTYSSPPSPEVISNENAKRNSKRREHSLHRYA